MDLTELYQAIREKSLESLQTLVANKDSGAVSTAEARVALKTLFDAVSGFAGTDVMELISETSAELGAADDRFTNLRRLFMKDGELVCLEYQFGETRIGVKKRSAGAKDGWERMIWKEFGEHPMPFLVARARFDEYVSSLLRQDYKEALLMLIAFVDTETTGLKPDKGDKIIEIAIVVYDVDTRRKLGALVQRFNPLRSIHPAAQAVHGITLEELRDAPLYKDFAPKIDAILRRVQVLAGQNIMFDAEFLHAEQSAAGYSLPEHLESFCTMENGRWACPSGKNPNLRELCFALNVPYDAEQAHGALYDIERTADCFWRGVDLGHYKLPEVTV